MNLSRIRQAIIKHPDNAWATKRGWKPVYTAHPSARIIIIGQAPGRLAQESTIPWDDPSGDNLRSWMNIDRETFYDKKKIALVPMDFYFPGSKERGDVPPRPGFAELWHPQILKELPNITLTLLIGQYSQKRYLGDIKKKTLTGTVKSYKEYLPGYFPVVHPSPRNNIWQKKNPWFQSNVLPAFRKAVAKALK